MGIAPNQDYEPIKMNNENLLLLNRNTLVDWGHKFIINNNSISISFENQNKVKKNNINLLSNNTNGNEKFSNPFLNDGILNVREIKRKDNKVDFKKYMVIKEDKYILRYIVLILSILFPVLFIIMIIYKLNSLSVQQEYFEGHINFEMVGLTLVDVLSKVINKIFEELFFWMFITPKIIILV